MVALSLIFSQNTANQSYSQLAARLPLMPQYSLDATVQRFCDVAAKLRSESANALWRKCGHGPITIASLCAGFDMAHIVASSICKAACQIWPKHASARKFLRGCQKLPDGAGLLPFKNIVK